MKQIHVFDKKILVAQTAGFCMGVKRGVQMAIKGRSSTSENLFIYGPLVHNEQVIEVLESLEIHGLNEQDVEKGDFPEESTILIRAHGVPPSEIKLLEEKGFKIRDATCPHVTRAQRIASFYSEKGYFCIIFGDSRHAEVKGILGYTRGRGHASTDASSLANLEISSDTPLCVLSQTTQDKKQFQLFVTELMDKYRVVEVQNTICNATKERQAELKELVRKVDLMIILGGKHSGNTRRLYEIARENLPNTIWVETPGELEGHRDVLLKSENIGISAGASTPQWIIDSVQEKIEKIIIHQKNAFLGQAYDFLKIVIRLSFVVGLAAGFSALFWSLFFETPLHSHFFLLTVLYVFSMHFGHRLKEIEYKDPSNFKVYRRNEGILWKILFIILFSGAVTGFFVSLFTGVTYSLLALAGMAYISPGKRFFLNSLHVIPGSKDFAVALAWAFLAVVLPARSALREFPLFLVPVAFTYIATAVFFRILLLDLLDFQSDRIMGRDTLITILHRKKYRQLLFVIWGLNIISLILLFPLMMKWTTFLVMLTAGLLGIRILVNKKPVMNRYVFETLLDGLFILPVIAGLFL